jgi:hypothetical protein
MTISPTFALQAHTLLQTGKVEEAIALCERGLEVYPDYATAYGILARAYEQMEKSSTAAAVLERGIQRLPLERSLLRMKTLKESNRPTLSSRSSANPAQETYTEDTSSGMLFTPPAQERDIPASRSNSTNEQTAIDEPEHTTIEWDIEPEIAESVASLVSDKTSSIPQLTVDDLLSEKPETGLLRHSYVVDQEAEPTTPGELESQQPEIEQPAPEIQEPQQEPGIELPEPDKPEIELPEPQKPEIQEPEQEPGIELPEPDKPEIQEPEKKPEIELPEPHKPEIEVPEPQKPEIQEPEKKPEIELPEPEKPEIELPEPRKPEIQEPQQEPGIELPEPQQPEIELPSPAQPPAGDQVQTMGNSETRPTLSLRSSEGEQATNGTTSARHSHLRIIESADTAEMPSLIWRSRNVRLIPGLEFTPLRFESKKDKLYRPAYRIPDPPPFPEFEITKKKPIRFQQRQEDSRAALTPLEELARRLEAARIPRVEEEEVAVLPPPPAPRSEQSSPMVTETMAKIYEMQGAIGEAVKAYEALAQQKPEMAEQFMKKARELKNRL